MTGPWSVLTYGQVEAGFRYHWSLDYTAVALASNATIVFMSAGPVVVAAAAIGLVVVILRKGERNALTVSMAALLSAVWTFQCVVPAAIQARYLIPLFPPLVILAVHGAAVAARRILALLARAGRPIRHQLAWAPAALVFATALPFAARTPTLPAAAFAAPADAVWAVRIPADPVVLLAVNANSEGTAVARPRHAGSRSAIAVRRAGISAARRRRLQQSGLHTIVRRP